MKSTERETDSPFNVRAENTLSRSERYRMLLDESIFVPFWILWSDWRGKVGLFISFIFILIGMLGPIIVDPPSANQAPQLLPPFENTAVILGTDNLGRSLLGLLVHATPPMLQMIIAGAVFTTGVATVVGMLSGYKGGLLDTFLTYITDIMVTIPGLPLVIILAALFQPQSPFVIGIVLSVNAWAGLARAIRSQVLTIRKNSYVEASRTLGLSTPYILVKDILPNIMSYVLINFVNSARRIIFSSVALYFLGVLSVSTYNWGVVLQAAYQYGALSIPSLRYWAFLPIALIVFVSIGLIFLAQATDRIFNPRLKARHEKINRK